MTVRVAPAVGEPLVGRNYVSPGRLKEAARRRLRAGVATWSGTLLSIALGLVPTRRVAVVYSEYALEGNAVEVVRWLTSNFGGRTVWLLGRDADPDVAARILALEADDRMPEVRSRGGLRSLRWFLRAEIFFFTQSTFGRPRPRGSRLFVNVWHGDPLKSATQFRHEVPAHVTVCGTRTLGREKALALGCDPEELVVSGNPRIDQFARPADDDALRLVGVDPDRPIVLWAPTFRHAQAAPGRPGWSDASEAYAFAEFADDDQLARLCQRTGLQLIVKPHPLDVASFVGCGVHVVSDSDLGEARITLYQLLARADALVTDYSSIWIDYLPLRRPVGLYCPDFDDYVSRRGLTLEEESSALPGPLLRDLDGLCSFLADVLSGADPGSVERESTIERLEVVTDLGATSRLMRELAERYAWRA